MVAMDCEETSIVVYLEEEPHWTVTIILTSPAVRQQPAEGTVCTVTHVTVKYVCMDVVVIQYISSR